MKTAAEQWRYEMTAILIMRATWIARCLDGHVGPDHDVVLNGRCYAVDSNIPPGVDLERIQECSK